MDSITINEGLKIQLDDISEIKLKKGNGRCDKIIFAMPEISQDDISSAYNGKPGCMCGCIGKHSYLKTSQAYASKERGYEVKDDEISERSVKFVWNKLNKEARRGIEVHEDYIYALELNGRSYVLYLKKA